MQRGIFVRSAKVFPLQSLTGWKPDPNEIRRIYGATEIVSGMMLMLGRGIVCDIANGALMGLILFSLYGNWALGEGIKESSHGIVLGLVLSCRLVIRLQVSPICPIRRFRCSMFLCILFGDRLP